MLRRYCRADFLVIDDFAVLAMDPAQANLAFQVITDRYDYRRSTCITTNRSFKDWPKVFPDALNAQVIAERLTERAERFIIRQKGLSNNEAFNLTTPRAGPNASSTLGRLHITKARSFARRCATAKAKNRSRANGWVPGYR